MEGYKMLNKNHKIIIYQMFVRYFGNRNTTNTYNGSIEENGSGKFNDINERALTALKELGIDYIWYTGVIEHATTTDYTAFGIKNDNPGIIKGRAGSPFAIKDYYDVAPDLAMDVNKRMAEYEALIKRTHALGMKVLMDFVPNHVARSYYSDVKSPTIKNFGENDDVNCRFDPKNDFYYIPNEKFIAPIGDFDEFPAKATGNNVFSATPSINDWFETIKLNYGVDMQNKTKNFFPQPPVWKKMRDILAFWAAKGVNGFRCDMAEFVPVEFWNWVITDLKKKYPHLIFIGEAYERKGYRNFIFNGKFSYLYDKVGLYDSLKRLIRADQHADVNEITYVWKHESNGFSDHMLRFLENHDETRIASKDFAGNPWYAVPGMVITATLAGGPVMIFNGQEVGEPALGSEGFSGDDGRTTIFDYWGMPQHQKWMNNGAFDGGQLSEEDKNLRAFYAKLLNIAKTNEAISHGDFHEILAGQNVYAFVRYTSEKRVLIISNFNRSAISLTLKFPTPILIKLNINKNTISFTDLLTETVLVAKDINEGLNINMPASGAGIFEF
ncbi:alpha-amylase family glycosyl hydrolase [Pedobacter sp. Du54]|uniref:alpha-amylase family glycosyl hydrolase n=1 Tax=Pedobacter anseongensis TaxID=3133439 RepID=UPI00309ED5C8